SLLLIALVVASVTASAFALFSSTTRVNGLTFSTGNADLQISSDGSTWGNTLTLNPAYTNMAVGFSNTQTFYLKNNSLSNISLKVSNKLLEGTQANDPAIWTAIGGKINIAFEKYNGTIWTSLVSRTISQWKDTGFDIDSLAFNTSQKYRLIVTTSALENTDAGQVLSDLSFNFTGTQE
ncbi:MAG TPA: hypothetical protein PKI92_01540, partial [Candidatus Woesebacteria bacterium]|nr:hypothetical protein [Candidatus Woesebacteria bacterium]